MFKQDFYKKHLASVQKKLETVQRKKEGNNTPYVFERLLDEEKVLKEIEDFLWAKLE